MSRFEVGTDHPRSPDVQRLVEAHLAYARLHTPPENVHALGIDDLLEDGLSLFSIREGEELVGIGALKHLDESHAEIKSMHTSESARRRGAGRAMLDHLLSVARTRGYSRVSLETGSMAAFAAARTLYESAGFERCEPFAGYRPSPNSVCMTLEFD